MKPVPASSLYPDAAAPGAIQWACSGDRQVIAEFFAQKGRPFSAELVRTMDGSSCHIYYEPTLPGFRAAAEDLPVSKLFFNVDTLAFFAGRNTPSGDSLDVAGAILEHTSRPLDVVLSLSVVPSEGVFRSSLAKHFRSSAAHTPLHNIRPHASPSRGELAPWMQDFLKAGHRDRQERILVTRRAFEGRADHAQKLDEMLTSFRDPVFEHSKLSWEGGDVQFAYHPKDHGKLVMFYGTSMKQYWGEALTREELEFVLRQEFGADEAVYMDDVTPHVDYLLSLIPESNTALVSTPVCGDVKVARAAVDALIQHYGTAVPAELHRLSTLIPFSAKPLSKVPELQSALGSAITAKRTWRAPRDPAVEGRIVDFVKLHCPGDPAACIAPQRLPQWLEQEPELLRQWVEIGAKVRLTELMNNRMLELISAQMSDCTDLVEKADRAANRVAQLGFRVVRIPWLPAAPDSRRDWAGIAYANAALIDKTLFVPSFGLPAVEKEWFDRLRSDLPTGYKLIPIPARFLVLENGGLHCAIAFERQHVGNAADSTDHTATGTND